MSEPSDREKAAIRALYSGCMVREDMEALRGYVARVDRDLNDWEATAQKVVRLFDPLAKDENTVTPGLLHAVAQGAKAANKTLREEKQLAKAEASATRGWEQADSLHLTVAELRAQMNEVQTSSYRAGYLSAVRDVESRFREAGVWLRIQFEQVLKL